MAAAGRSADKRSVSYTGHAELGVAGRSLRLIADGIARVNARAGAEPMLAQSQIRRFVILGKRAERR